MSFSITPPSGLAPTLNTQQAPTAGDGQPVPVPTAPRGSNSPALGTSTVDRSTTPGPPRVAQKRKIPDGISSIQDLEKFLLDNSFTEAQARLYSYLYECRGHPVDSGDLSVQSGLLNISRSCADVGIKADKLALPDIQRTRRTRGHDYYIAYDAEAPELPNLLAQPLSRRDQPVPGTVHTDGKQEKHGHTSGSRAMRPEVILHGLTPIEMMLTLRSKGFSRKQASLYVLLYIDPHRKFLKDALQQTYRVKDISRVCSAASNHAGRCGLPGISEGVNDSDDICYWISGEHASVQPSQRIPAQQGWPVVPVYAPQNVYAISQPRPYGQPFQGWPGGILSVHELLQQHLPVTVPPPLLAQPTPQTPRPSDSDSSIFDSLDPLIPEVLRTDPPPDSKQEEVAPDVNPDDIPDLGVQDEGGM